MPTAAFAEATTPADYKVTVEVTTTNDRDTTNPGVDVFAGDKVTVKVIVSEDNFVAANVTLSYDKNNFKMTKSPAINWDGDYAGMDEYEENPVEAAKLASENA